MAEQDGLESGTLADLTLSGPSWTTKDLSRALAAAAPAAPDGSSRRCQGKDSPAESGGSFTLREAHAYEWDEIASSPGPGFTIVVYQAGPGYLVRRKVPDSDLLHLRTCKNRVEVCRYLWERMKMPFFAKVVWSFLGKVA